MAYSVVDLPWLPAAPADWLARCKKLTPDTDPASDLQQMALFALDARQSLALSRALERFRKAGARLEPLASFRLGLLAGNTADLLVDCLPAAALRHGVATAIVTAPYDQVMQQALDPTSRINSEKLDAVLVAVDHRWFGLDSLTAPAGSEERVAEAIGRLRTVVEGLRNGGGATAILQTMAVPPQALFGSFDRRVATSLRAVIEACNAAIVALAAETGNYILDTAALAERVGTDRWFDPVQWVSYKLPFAAECGPVYADHLGRLLGAIRGKARKCLVLDLDNTVWGGVIGDDGIEGIKLGQGSPRGEAFLSVQKLARELRDRGIFLAVSSKNDDAVARRAFREHPEMLLREDHVSVFQANWLDKASNLEAIAKALNIGLDALVLLDDNPAERGQLRAALPMVAVPELPQDPSWYAWMLAAAGYFEVVTFSAEDRFRADAVGSEARRAEVMANARDLGDYLTALQMVISFAPFDAAGRQRITQLINKTNQFNLTTRRYTEAEVAAIEKDEASFTLQVRLRDRFGDLGMIGEIIARPVPLDNAAWEIDTWLMSCRVLGREVERAMLTQLAEAGRRRGISRIIGRYIPTPKNGMVAEHYRKLGFSPLGAEPDGTTTWELDAAAFQNAPLPMTVEGGNT